MKCYSPFSFPGRNLHIFLCLGLTAVLGLWVPPAEAATSKDKRKLRALKKTLRVVKLNLANSRRALTIKEGELAMKENELAITEGELAMTQDELAMTEDELAMTEDELAMALEPAPFMEFVTVGDPGNSADSGHPLAPNIYGAVAETFKIGKTEVTNNQYVAFLNAVAETDTNGLFFIQMQTSSWGGIVQLGALTGYRYAVKPGMGDKPVMFMHYHNACRFCNWLHNGMPTGPQGASTTELGAYDLTAPVVLANNQVTRQPGAKYFIPTEDQWYKAAHYQPVADGGDTDSYWTYGTGSNSLPAEASVDALGDIINDNANLANYNRGADWNTEDGMPSTVRSGGPGSASYYGAYDMCGNAIEITEGLKGTINESRVARGGGFATAPDSIDQITRSSATPGSPNSDHGFRVACPAD